MGNCFFLTILIHVENVAKAVLRMGGASRYRSLCRRNDFSTAAWTTFKALPS